MQELSLRDELSNEVLEIPKHRGKARDELIKSICDKFIAWLRFTDLLAFPREHINTLVCINEERTKERIVTQIINHLKTTNKIRELGIKKTYYGYHKKDLASADYGSYAVLMQRNGYKRKLYNWNGLKKSKIATLELNQVIPQEIEDFDLSEIQSTKPQDKQGCISFGNKSFYKSVAFEKEIKVYELI